MPYDVLEPETQNTEPEPAVATPPGFWERPKGQRVAAGLIMAVAVVTIVYGAFYLKFAQRIDHRLATGPFSDTVNIFTAPRTLAIGDAVGLDDVLKRLRHSGYTTSRGNPMGWYNLRPQAVEIFPGRDSFAGGEPGVIHFANGKVARIVSLQDNTERQEYPLEPQLLASVSEGREHRRLVRFADIPPALEHAVVAVEDKRFFQHSGFDLSRIFKAAYVDMKDGRKEQGASTLTMQLARGIWLDGDKQWRRKLAELMITMHLEEKLSKQQIFEYYANQVYLGRRGTFSINGFGEAARAYFGKDLSQITVPEAALLAGMVQRPTWFNPFRYPDRAKARRDLVLGMMRQNGYLSEPDYQKAKLAPLQLTAEAYDGIESQYFVDLMNDELQSKFEDRESRTHYIYTTLDPDLQSAAEAAVREGMGLVDKELGKGKKHPGLPAGQPQVALIALDPHTGEIKALVGGRNYALSQLNHVLAMRQPGSVFKPFVYAAAMNTALERSPKIFTPATLMDDSPMTFQSGSTTYQPGNFHHEFMGDVTLRSALAHSLNVVAVQVAQQVGYDRVVAMARRAGLNSGIKPTPSVALGAYETTPLEIAGAYTVFANQGVRLTPTTLSLVRSADGTVLYQRRAQPTFAMDQRVAFLMVSMMQDVLRSGTGAAVRSRGFSLPAAGKTGTSRDGWFAGFTSGLLCVVWVGFDDNRELNLEGARSALPIWTEFMKRATKFRDYRTAHAFQAPAGIVSVRICSDSGDLAGDSCPSVRSDFFIDGTQPVVECPLHTIQVIGAGQPEVSVLVGH